MGRHSDGKNNYSLSSWVIGTIVAVIVLIALVVWWLWPSGNAADSAAGGEEEATNECIQGELVLPIATDATSAEATRQLIDDWAATAPVVRDYCVVPELSDDLAGAAAYVGVTTSAVEESGRGTATSSGTPVVDIPVGVAGVAGEDPANAGVEQVSFPVADQPGLAQVVATALADDSEQALGVLNRDLDVTTAQAAQAPLWATTESGAEDVNSFAEVTSIEAGAIVLSADGDVTEEQERAAAAFVEQAGEQYQAPEGGAQSVDTQLLAELNAAPDSESEAETPTAETPTPDAVDTVGTVVAADTLFVLDTSQYMEGSMGSLGAAVQDSAGRLTGAGESVALWNYSSPLNPGVTQGWRQNLGFGANPGEVGEVVGRFGTGGVPQSRSATVAAVNVARDQAATTGQPVRVVVVTTGTESDMSDEVFADSLNTGEGVELTVIHVGTGQADPVLAEAADQSYDLDGLGQLPATLNEAAGV